MKPHLLIIPHGFGSLAAAMFPFKEGIAPIAALWLTKSLVLGGGQQFKKAAGFSPEAAATHPLDP